MLGQAVRSPVLGAADLVAFGDGNEGRRPRVRELLAARRVCTCLPCTRRLRTGRGQSNPRDDRGSAGCRQGLVAPLGFDYLVRLQGLTTTVSAQAGVGNAAPSVSRTGTISYWNGTGYSSLAGDYGQLDIPDSADVDHRGSGSERGDVGLAGHGRDSGAGLRFALRLGCGACRLADHRQHRLSRGRRWSRRGRSPTAHRLGHAHGVGHLHSGMTMSAQRGRRRARHDHGRAAGEHGRARRRG